MSIHSEVGFHVWNSEPAVGDFFDKIVDLHEIKSFLEVGVFQGLASYPLISKLKKNLVGIDIEDYRLPIVKKEWVKHKSWFIQNDSFTVLEAFQKEERKFDAIFIDSFHSYEQCSGEYWRARKCINKGGLIMFHDSILIEGVIQFVAELKERQKELNIELITLKTPDMKERGGASGLTIVRHL